MSYSRLATIENELNKQIDTLTLNLSSFLDSDSWDVKRLLADAKKLIRVDAPEGHCALGKIYHLCGNVEMMRYHFDNAYRLNRDIDFIGVRSACESNLGFMTEAKKFFAIVGDPLQGSLSKCVDIAFTCGAFSLLNEYIERAEKMGIELSPGDVNQSRAISKIFAEAGISDDYISSVLDIAGAVMRERKVVSKGGGSSLISLENGCVFYTHSLSLPGEIVADIGEAFADRLARSPLPLFDEICVAFRPI